MVSVLSLANAEDFGAAHRADALGRRPAVFQRDLLGIAYLLFAPTLKAVGFHDCTPKYKFGYAWLKLWEGKAKRSLLNGASQT